MCMFAYKANKEYVKEMDATLDGRVKSLYVYTHDTRENRFPIRFDRRQRESVNQTEKAYERSEQ